MAIAPLRLPRLKLTDPIVSADTGKPSTTFQRYWQTVLEAIERSVNGVIDALNAAQAAQETADEALSTAGTMSPALSLSISYPIGVTITGADIGLSVGADIAISNHTRHYGNGDDVSVNVSAVTGAPFAYDATLYIYYDQASRLGGAVTYYATTTEAGARSAANPDRHYVGSIVTPSDGGANTTGTPASYS